MTSLTQDTPVEDVAGRIFESVAATADVFTIYLGERLGLYRAMHAGGPQTCDELATRTGVLPRFTREWCESQAANGWIECGNPADSAEQRVFSLPPAMAEAMLDKDSLAFLSPAIRMLVAAGQALPGLMKAYRGEGTVSWDDYGPDMREGQAEMNRPVFLALLADDWLGRVPGLRDRLGTPGARVAEVGCGLGWASIALARAFPGLAVDGYDLDEPSIASARANARAEGLADRVRFLCDDVAAPQEPLVAYDLVMACECVHDMSNPVDVLRTMGAMAGDQGEVLVIDERTEDQFMPDAQPMERLLYGFSVLVCLPDGMSSQPSAGTGTVMRASTMDRYARDAGFSGGAEVVDLEHDQFRMYRLHR